MMKPVPGKMFVCSMIAGGAIAYLGTVLATLTGPGQAVLNLMLILFKALVVLFG